MTPLESIYIISYIASYLIYTSLSRVVIVLKQTDAQWDSVESHSNSTPRGYGAVELEWSGVEWSWSFHSMESNSRKKKLRGQLICKIIKIYISSRHTEHGKEGPHNTCSLEQELQLYQSITYAFEYHLVM